jgi:hypothetical protein
MLQCNFVIVVPTYQTRQHSVTLQKIIIVIVYSSPYDLHMSKGTKIWSLTLLFAHSLLLGKVRWIQTGRSNEVLFESRQEERYIGRPRQGTKLCLIKYVAWYSLGLSSSGCSPVTWVCKYDETNRDIWLKCWKWILANDNTVLRVMLLQRISVTDSTPAWPPYTLQKFSYLSLHASQRDVSP